MTSLDIIGDVQLTDILCVLLLETETTEMIPIVDQGMLVNCD